MKVVALNVYSTLTVRQTEHAFAINVKTPARELVAKTLIVKWLTIYLLVHADLDLLVIHSDIVMS